MFRFFMSRRYVNFYFLLQNASSKKKPTNMHQLSKEADMTISHTTNVTDQLEREGLILKKRNGRECSIEITESGKQFGEILKSFCDLAEKLNVAKNNGTQN